MPPRFVRFETVQLAQSIGRHQERPLAEVEALGIEPAETVQGREALQLHEAFLPAPDCERFLQRPAIGRPGGIGPPHSDRPGAQVHSQATRER